MLWRARAPSCGEGGDFLWSIVGGGSERGSFFDSGIRQGIEKVTFCIWKGYQNINYGEWCGINLCTLNVWGMVTTQSDIQGTRYSFGRVYGALQSVHWIEIFSKRQFEEIKGFTLVEYIPNSQQDGKPFPTSPHHPRLPGQRLANRTRGSTSRWVLSNPAPRPL